jgi:hypothetical protein
LRGRLIGASACVLTRLARLARLARPARIDRIDRIGGRRLTALRGGAG